MIFSSQWSSHGKIIATVAIASVLVLATVGMHGMMESDGSMSACPFMSDTTTLCPMTVTQHLSQWQSLLRAILPPAQSLVLLAVALLLIFWTVQYINPLRLLNPPNHALIFFYRWYLLMIRSLDRMLLAFSDGILNSRLFA